MSLSNYEIGYCVRGNPRAGTQAPASNQRRPGGSNSRHRLSCELRFATINVGTMTGKRVDVVELMKMGAQETKWKGDRAVNVGEGFKMLHAGGDRKINRVGAIMNEEYRKEVIRVERWGGRFVAVWTLVGRQMMCMLLVYAPQTERTQEDKDAFRSNLEEIIGHVEPETVLVVAGDMNAHVGKIHNSEETVGMYGWGSRNREGQDLVEMLARNQLVVVNAFFQKRESRKITYISGNNRTEIDLLIVRSCQRNKVRDCKVLAGEHITSRHKPLVYDMRIGKDKQRRSKQRQVIWWWKCEGEVVKKYKSKVDRKFRLLKEQREDVEAEWTAFKEGFVGTAEEICGRTSGKPT